MEKIDFLPKSYREKQTRRQSRLAVIVLTSMFGVTIAGAATGQFAVWQSVKSEVNEIEIKYVDAVAKNNHHQKLTELLNAQQEVATLYSYLDHTWPHTQLLSELLKPLPESIILSELRFSYGETARAPEFLGFRINPEASQEENLSGPLADVASLRKLRDGKKHVLHVHGITTNTSELHKFVSRLHASPLFTKALVGSVESIEGDEDGNLSSKISRFELRVEIKPGYGQPGGPQGAPATEAVELASRGVQ